MSNKKGGAARRRTAPQTQYHNTTISSICLLLFGVFAVLTIYGAYKDNAVMTYFGLGIGVAVTILMLEENLKEDRDE